MNPGPTPLPIGRSGKSVSLTSRRDRMKVAQRFIAGSASEHPPSPVGTTEALPMSVVSVVPTGLGCIVDRHPAPRCWATFILSLRDEKRSRPAGPSTYESCSSAPLYHRIDPTFL